MFQEMECFKKWKASIKKIYSKIFFYVFSKGSNFPSSKSGKVSYILHISGGNLQILKIKNIL